MVIAAFPQPDQTPPPTLTYAQLKQERDQAIGRVKHLEEKLTKAVELEGRVFELEEWKAATKLLLATPNNILSPAERIAVYALRDFKQRKEEEGNTGHQVFKSELFAKDTGLGIDRSRKILHKIADTGAINLRVEEEGEKKNKRYWFTVKCLDQLDTPPTTWGTARDPNGKICGCKAGTETTVTDFERRTSFTRVQTRCKRVGCKRIHSTIFYNRTVIGDDTPIGTSRHFDTEAEAIAVVEAEKSVRENGGQTPENAVSSLGQNETSPPHSTSSFRPPSGSTINQGKDYIDVPEHEPIPSTALELLPAESIRVEPSTSIEDLLLAIAGPDPQHLELLPTGDTKCTTHAGPVTLELVQRMIAGTYSPGTRLSYPNGMTRAICLDADNSATKQTLIDAACKLSGSGASPLLESSPSIHHKDNVHLWLVFDGLVNAAAAWATIEAAAPELSGWSERWPGRRTCIRLPGAYYRRPGAEGWCQLWRPGGMHRTEGAAFGLLLDQQTPACWVTASPPPPEPTPTSRPAFPVSSRVYTDGRPILQGARDDTLFSRASGIANRVSGEELVEAVRQVNEKCCRPPLPDCDVLRIARSAEKKARRLDA